MITVTFSLTRITTKMYTNKYVIIEILVRLLCSILRVFLGRGIVIRQLNSLGLTRIHTDLNTFLNGALMPDNVLSAYKNLQRMRLWIRHNRRYVRFYGMAWWAS